MIPTASDLIQEATAACLAKDFRAAVTASRLLTALDPTLPEGWLFLGSALGQLGDTHAGRTALDECLRLAPGFPAAHWNRAFLRLTDRLYSEGWADYEWGRVNGMRPTRSHRPQWYGQPTRELLVWAEQGAGDVIQFSRWVPQLIEQHRTREVIFECPLPLVRLLQAQPWPGVTVRALPPHGGLGDERPPHVALLSLPYVLSLGAQDISGKPYLSAPAEAGLLPKLHVGLCWQGNPQHDNDAKRSLPDLLAEELVRLHAEEIQWGTLQHGKPGLPGVPNLTEEGDDWYDTAAWVQSLDLLVTVDTGTAHLAGALGVPTLLLLCPVPDWRWGMLGDCSPWYDSFMLLRCQEKWVDLLPRVEERLRVMLDRRKENLRAAA